MSAQIIQFGQPQCRTCLDSSPDVRRRAIRQRVEKCNVRFMFGDELHEAKFYDAKIQAVHVIQYRSTLTVLKN